MATVRIYAGNSPEVSHVELQDRLETTKNSKSIASAVPTGPFTTHRDVYVFAVSVGIAAGSPTPVEDMPPTSAGDREIKAETLLEAPGARELVTLMAVVPEMTVDDESDPEDELRQRIELLADPDLSTRLKLLDRYAHAGFEIIRSHEKGTVRDALLALLSVVEGPLVDAAESPEIDPVAYFLT